jgi:predicted RNA-binding protein
MERLTKEYIELLSSPGNVSEHFWELEKKIKYEQDDYCRELGSVQEIMDEFLIVGQALGTKGQNPKDM